MSQSPGLTLYIYNGVEHEWDFIVSLKSKKKQSAAIRSSEYLADTYLFANPDTTCIFVSPLPIDRNFVCYVERLLNSSFTILVPQKHNHLLAQHLAHDKKCIDQIVQSAKNFGNRITIKSYSSSIGIHEVATALRLKGLRVTLYDTTARTKLSTVHYFGSKSGFRKEFSSLMPKGYVCSTPKEALIRAEELYKNSVGFVCKTDRGCAGEGVHIVRKKYPFEKVKAELRKLFSQQLYWNTFPIIVEEYITPDMQYCPFPSIEGYIDSKGKLSFPYYCNMIVTKKGEFFGVEIHKNVLSPKLTRELIRKSTQIGSRYVKAGYRGTFDIDFLHDGKKLYANESNMRTNGGTDTFITARKLIGKDYFTSRYVLSNYFNFPKQTKYTFTRLASLLKRCLYNPMTKTGVIIGSALALRQRGVSYMVITKSKAEANKLQKKLILTIKKNQE